MLEITHSHAEGTIIWGTSRGDGSAEVLKGKGWRWARSLGAWYVPHSRDKLAKHFVIERTKKALEVAGFEVSVTVDAGTRSTAEVEADRAERQAERAAGLEAKAERRAAAAAAAWGRADAARDELPEGGEPIKIGHHSERRHRRALDKAWSSLGTAVQASDAAEEAARRAEIAARAGDRRYNPTTVANRIEKLAAEVRDCERRLTGHRRTVSIDSNGTRWVEETRAASGEYQERIEARLAEKQDQLAYWQSVREQQLADGLAFGPEQIGKGDRVLTEYGDWVTVLRVNRKSVTVQDRQWSRTLAYGGIKGHKKSE